MIESVNIINLEKIENLAHKLTLEIPESDIEAKLDIEASELAKTKQIKGYRKGKVPVAVIKQMFGQELRARILSQLMDQHFGLAAKEKGLKVASMPAYALLPSESEGLTRFSASFEIMPDIKLPSFKGLKVVCQKAEVNDEAVDRMLDKFREQHGQWEKVERAAALGDQVNMNFVGKLDGVPFEGGSADGSDLELGAGQFIEGFEDGLVGLSAGESKTLDLTFPKQYHAEELAGKAVTFDVSINHVNGKQLPELNEAFIKQLGINSGSVDELRTELRSTMEREAKKGEQQKAKQAVFDALSEKASFDLPLSLIDQEIMQMQKDMEKRMLESGGSKDKMPELPRGIFEEQATQRVKLGLLVTEIIKQHDIKVDEARLDETIATLAEQYQDAKQVIQWYNEHPEERQKLSSVVLEDQVVDLVKEKAKISEEIVTYEALLNQEQ